MDHAHHGYHLGLASPGHGHESLNRIAWVATLQVALRGAPALAVAGVAAYPLNRRLIARGKGHALAYAGHGMA